MSKFTITLSNGKRLDDLSQNGSMYVSPVEITMNDLSSEAISSVTILETDDEGHTVETVMENAVCDNVIRMPEGWLFNLREPDEIERMIRQVYANVGIVEDGDFATHNITAGQFLIWKNCLYKAIDVIAVGTKLSTSMLTAVLNGAANDLNDRL